MIKQRFSYLLSIFILTFTTGISSSVYADDTEIYLGVDPDAGTIKHNILFILDTSFSMKNKVDVNEDGDTKDAVDVSRIAVLQDALDSIVGSLDNANVGYVRMNGAESPTKSGTSKQCNAAQIAAGASEFKNLNIATNNSGKVDWKNGCYLPTGGAVMFPIADLDEPASSVTGEPATFTLNVPISSSADDADQP
jgi:hypothetical protein